MRGALISLAVVAMAALSAANAQEDDHGHGHSYAPPDLSTLGGPFALREVRGAPFTEAQLKGGWTLLYFGYARCRSACPTALPALSAAAADLRERDVLARAVFVDIEAPAAPLQLRSQSGQSQDHHHHDAGHVETEAALADLAQAFPNVSFLTGSRLQVRRAATAFRVRTEHVPARTSIGETGHSINHTTVVFVIDPSGAVAGYLYHTATPEEMAAYVADRAGA